MPSDEYHRIPWHYHKNILPLITRQEYRTDTCALEDHLEELNQFNSKEV